MDEEYEEMADMVNFVLDQVVRMLTAVNEHRAVAYIKSFKQLPPALLAAEFAKEEQS